MTTSLKADRRVSAQCVEPLDQQDLPFPTTSLQLGPMNTEPVLRSSLGESSAPDCPDVPGMHGRCCCAAGADPSGIAVLMECWLGTSKVA